jgi:hypothetical protein
MEVVQVEVSEVVHASLRTWADELGWPLSDFIRCLVEEALLERFPKMSKEVPIELHEPPSQAETSRKFAHS